MAVTPTHITDGASTGNPATTASVNPAAGALLLCAVAVTKTATPAPGDGDVAITGLGLTWELVASVPYRARRRLWLFRAQGSPAEGTLGISYGGAATFQEMQWAVAQWAGVVVGGNGADALAGAATAATETGSASLTVTIGGTPAAGDATAAWFGLEEAGGPPTVEAGWDELSTRESANVRHLITAADPGLDQTATVSWSSSGNGAGGVGAVVLAGEGGEVPAEGTAAAGLGLSLQATGSRDSAGQTAAGLGLSLASVGARPSQGAAAFQLRLTLAGTGVAMEPDAASGTAELGIGLRLAAVGSRPSQGTAAFRLGLSLAAAGPTSIAAPGSSSVTWRSTTATVASRSTTASSRSRSTTGVVRVR